MCALVLDSAFLWTIAVADQWDRAFDFYEEVKQRKQNMLITLTIIIECY